MSEVINPKYFNLEQQIVRAEFQGHPNLFTTADLNRQISLLRAADKYGGNILSDLSVTVSGGKFNFTCSYIIYNGVLIKDPIINNGNTTSQIPTGVASNASTYYLNLYIKFSYVSRSDDGKISGAVFGNSGVYDAAGHYVIGEAQIKTQTKRLSYTHNVDIEPESNLEWPCCTLASVENGNVILHTIPFIGGGDYRFYSKNLPDNDASGIKFGDTFSDAIVKICDKLRQINVVAKDVNGGTLFTVLKGQETTTSKELEYKSTVVGDVCYAWVKVPMGIVMQSTSTNSQNSGKSFVLVTKTSDDNDMNPFRSPDKDISVASNFVVWNTSRKSVHKQYPATLHLTEATNVKGSTLTISLPLLIHSEDNASDKSMTDLIFNFTYLVKHY